MTRPERPPGMDPTTWRFQNMGEAIVRREVEIQRLRDEAEELSERLASAQLTIGQLSHERARLRGLLARLEWSAPEWMETIHGMCPVCCGIPGSGHEPGCWLAAEL